MRGYGGAGADVLKGDADGTYGTREVAGDDIIDGGSGADRLSGGDGDDHVRFEARSCGAGNDIVEGGLRLAVTVSEREGEESWRATYGNEVSRA